MTRFHAGVGAGASAVVAGWTLVLAQMPTAEFMSLGLRGAHFVENRGQWRDVSVEYGFKTRGLDIAFRESSFTMYLTREAYDASPTLEGGAPDDGAWAAHPCELVTPPEGGSTRERGWCVHEGQDPLPHERGSSGEYEHLTLTVTFPGSNPATPRGAQPQAAKFNYYIGDDESRWASNVSSFGAIIYENLYDGVDLLVRGNDDGVLKYEFYVAPGADWSQIRTAYDGIDSLCVVDSGDLRIKTSFGTLTDSAPVVWQEDRGKPMSGGTAVPAVQGTLEEPTTDDGRDARATDRNIPARFELIDDTTYRFVLDGAVDPTRTLIIDPDVEWMVYLGGGNFDFGYDMAIDASGDIYVVGHSWSQDFEGRNNQYHGSTYDAFLVKVRSEGVLDWMTYLGGTSRDWGEAVEVGAAGNIYTAGGTVSTDFAGHNNSFRGGATDAFLASVAPSGALQWMTYLGGSTGDECLAMSATISNEMILVGRTDSTNFDGRLNSKFGNLRGAWDAFVASVDGTGSVRWMRYLGGGASDIAHGVAVDRGQMIWITGETESNNFEGRINSRRGQKDGFAATVDHDGTLQWMVYLGGQSDDLVLDVAVDTSGRAFLTGYTRSTDFDGAINRSLGAPDAFAARVSVTGDVAWTIYLGGSGHDRGHAIAVSLDDRVIVAGATGSLRFAGASNAYYGDTTDAFTLSLNPDGTVRRMAYSGGADDQDEVSAVYVDEDGSILLGGWTASADFVGRTNDFHGGNADAFVLRLHLEDGPSLDVSSSCPDGGPIEVRWRDATANGRVGIMMAREVGYTQIPANLSCAGAILGISGGDIRTVFAGSSGPDGSRTLSGAIGPGACGATLLLLDQTTCTTSNLVRID